MAEKEIPSTVDEPKPVAIVASDAQISPVVLSPERSLSSEVLGMESREAGETTPSNKAMFIAVEGDESLKREEQNEGETQQPPVESKGQEEEQQEQQQAPQQIITAGLLHRITKKLQRTYVHSQHVLAAQWNADHLQLFLLTFQQDDEIPSTSDPTNRQLIDLDQLFQLAHTEVNRYHQSHHHHHHHHSPTNHHHHHHHNHKNEGELTTNSSSEKEREKKVSRKILILGGPQVGKSTLLEHIALQWSQESLFHRDFRAVFHIRLRLFFTDWKQEFTEEELQKYPLHCYLWFCIQQEPGYYDLIQGRRDGQSIREGGEVTNDGFIDSEGDILTKEEVFTYLSLPTSIDETLLLVHRFDEVDQYLQSVAEHSIDNKVFESIFEYTHVIFTAREGFTYSPTMKRFDRFVEGRIVKDHLPSHPQQGSPSHPASTSNTDAMGPGLMIATTNSMDAYHNNGQPHILPSSSGSPKVATSSTNNNNNGKKSPSHGSSPSLLRSFSRSPSMKNPLAMLAAGLGVGSRDHHDDHIVANRTGTGTGGGGSVTTAGTTGDKESQQVDAPVRKRSINSPRAANAAASTAAMTGSSSSGSPGTTTTGTGKRIHPETNYQDQLLRNEEAKYSYMAQNMIMNVTVIMECDKLGFTSSEKLDDLQSKLSYCLQHHSYLFDTYPHKEVIDAFTSQLHRQQVLYTVKEPFRAIEINDSLVQNLDFWRRYGKLVSNDLAGIEEEVEDLQKHTNGTRSSCVIS